MGSLPRRLEQKRKEEERKKRKRVDLGSAMERFSTI